MALIDASPHKYTVYFKLKFLSKYANSICTVLFRGYVIYELNDFF